MKCPIIGDGTDPAATGQDEQEGRREEEAVADQADGLPTAAASTATTPVQPRHGPAGPHPQQQQQQRHQRSGEAKDIPLPQHEVRHHRRGEQGRKLEPQRPGFHHAAEKAVTAIAACRFGLRGAAATCLRLDDATHFRPARLRRLRPDLAAQRDPPTPRTRRRKWVPPLVPVQDGAGPEEDVQGRRGVNVMKRFFFIFPPILLRQNKLDRLSLAGFSRLV